MAAQQEYKENDIDVQIKALHLQNARLEQENIKLKQDRKQWTQLKTDFKTLKSKAQSIDHEPPELNQLEAEQLNAEALSAEHQQLQSAYDALKRSYQKDMEDLQTKFDKLTAEKAQLETQFSHLLSEDQEPANLQMFTDLELRVHNLESKLAKQLEINHLLQDKLTQKAASQPVSLLVSPKSRKSLKNTTKKRLRKHSDAPKVSTKSQRRK